MFITYSFMNNTNLQIIRIIKDSLHSGKYIRKNCYTRKIKPIKVIGKMNTVMRLHMTNI